MTTGGTIDFRTRGILLRMPVFTFKFPYNEGLKDKLKAAVRNPKDNLRWCAAPDRLWECKGSDTASGYVVRNFGHDHHFTFTAAAAEHLRKLGIFAAGLEQKKYVDFGVGGDRFTIHLPYADRNISDMLEAKVPLVQFNGTLCCYTVPKIMAAKVFDFCAEYEIEGSEAAYKAFEDAKLITDESSGLVANLLVPGLKANCTPYPYQLAGMKFLANNQKCLLGDSMRLGKCLQSIGAALVAGTWPVLIVCPKTARSTWINEIQKWTEKSVHSVGSKTGAGIWYLSKYWKVGQEAVLHSDFYVVTYEGLRTIQHCKHRFRTVIIDEAHYVKNPNTIRFENLKAFTDFADRVVLVTGTPLVNRIEEACVLVKLLGQQDKFGGSFTMAQMCTRLKQLRQTVKTEWRTEEERSNAAVAIQSISEGFGIQLRQIMIRREQKDVWGQLPEKRRVYERVKLSNEPEYLKCRDEFYAYLRQNKGFTAGQAQKSLYMETLAKIGHLRQLSGLGKVQEVAEYVLDILETEGEKVVVFCAYHATYDALLRALVGVRVAHFDGRTNELDRDTAIKDFQNPDGARVMVTSKAGGVAVSFSAGTLNVFLDQYWTAADHEQAEARVEYKGRTGILQSVYFLGHNTVDEDVLEIVEEKRALFNSVMQPGTIDSTTAKAILQKFSTLADESVVRIS